MAILQHSVEYLRRTAVTNNRHPKMLWLKTEWYLWKWFVHRNLRQRKQVSERNKVRDLTKATTTTTKILNDKLALNEKNCRNSFNLCVSLFHVKMSSKRNVVEICAEKATCVAICRLWLDDEFHGGSFLLLRVSTVRNLYV